MGKKAELRIEVIQKLALKQLTMADAMAMLGCSERTLYRVLARQKVDPLFFQHRNRGRRPSNRAPEAIRSAAQSLLKERYFDPGGHPKVATCGHPKTGQSKRLI